MLLDAQLLFSEAQGPFNTGTNASTNDIDLLVGGRQLGVGEPLSLFFKVVEAVVGATSTTEFQLVMDDNAAFSSPTIVYTSGAIPVASLILGATWYLGVPTPAGGLERYLRARYVVATANQTAGKYTSGIAQMVDQVRNIPRSPYPVA